MCIILTLNFKMADECQFESTGKRDNYPVVGQLLFKKYNCLQPLNKNKRAFKVIVIFSISYCLILIVDIYHLD